MLGEHNAITKQFFNNKENRNDKANKLQENLDSSGPSRSWETHQLAVIDGRVFPLNKMLTYRRYQEGNRFKNMMSPSETSPVTRWLTKWLSFSGAFQKA